MKLGINGLGRIGKLSLWHHVARKHFSGVVVNIGREVGRNLTDLAAMLEKDSTYGRLGAYLYGHKCPNVIEELNNERGTMVVNGIPVTILRTARNPKDIAWQDNGVKLVVDTTGMFTDPTTDPDAEKGALRGHMQAGADKVILSAPFKIKSKGLDMPVDAITTVMGINDEMYVARQHAVISAASCTTTCLSYMIKPLLEKVGADKILSASMVTVHAATGSQQVLDRLPKTGATDFRKNRSIQNNIGSLIILVVNLQDELDNPIKRNAINAIYKGYSEINPYLKFSEEQNVSSDIIGLPAAAAVIEGSETHTRTANIQVNLAKVKADSLRPGADPIVNVPVTQAVVYGWYDNELGSYTNMLGDLTVHVSEGMF